MSFRRTVWVKSATLWVIRVLAGNEREKSKKGPLPLASERRAAIPRSAGPLRWVRAVADRAAVCSQPHVEQPAARVVMAAVIECHRSSELFAGQLSLGIVLGVG